MSPAVAGVVVVASVQSFGAFFRWPTANTCMVHANDRRKMTIPSINSEEKPEPNFEGQGKGTSTVKVLC